MAPPAPATDPTTVNAFARSRGSVKVVIKSDRAEGASKAANKPWTARAMTSMAKPFAAPPTMEAVAKPARPTRNVTFCPTRSATRPPSSSRLPKASA